MIKLIKVLESRNIPFIPLIEKVYGVEAAQQAEQLHDNLLVSEKMRGKEEQKWRSDMQRDHIQFVKEFPDKNFMRQAQNRYKNYRQEELYKQYKAETDKVKKKALAEEIVRLESANHVTKIQIERARQYPISSVLPVSSGGFAKCVNHDDSKPSMFCKNNFGYCFVCSYRGDVIDIYMRIHGVSFGEAVLNLQ